MLTVDLVEEVGLLCPGVRGGTGPRAALGSVECLHVKFHDRAFRLGGKDSGMNPVPGDFVAAQTVVTHGGNRKRARGQAGDPVVNYSMNRGGEIVSQAGPDQDEVPGSGNGGVMRDLFDKGGDVNLTDRVRGTRSAPLNETGGPVLAEVITGMQVDQLKGPAPSVCRVVPGPAPVAAIIFAGSSSRPVPPIGVGYAVNLIAGVVEQPDGFAAVGEPPSPAPGDVQDPRMPVSERSFICCHHEVAVLGNADIGEGVVHSVQGPSSQVD